MADTVMPHLDKCFILHYPRVATTIPHNNTPENIVYFFFFFNLTKLKTVKIIPEH
jgi:hypothetical protein